jgi:hypothetical protein
MFISENRKIFAFIRVHPLPAITLAQARRAGWFFFIPIHLAAADPKDSGFLRKGG